MRDFDALAEACGPRYYALVLLACFCGLRWGELVALRRRDIDTATATAEPPLEWLEPATKRWGSHSFKSASQLSTRVKGTSLTAVESPLTRKRQPSES